MCADVRLDPATLREVADGIERYRQFTVAAFSAADATPSQAADAVLKDVIETCRKQATEAESQPPRLSDWVRACEGTGLGEPHWSGERRDDSGQIVAWFSDLAVVMHIDGEAGPVGATVTSDPREGTGDEHYTPAELRAALERLAGGRDG